MMLHNGWLTAKEFRNLTKDIFKVKEEFWLGCTTHKKERNSKLQPVQLEKSPNDQNTNDRNYESGAGENAILI